MDNLALAIAGQRVFAIIYLQLEPGRIEVLVCPSWGQSTIVPSQHTLPDDKLTHVSMLVMVVFFQPVSSEPCLSTPQDTKDPDASLLIAAKIEKLAFHLWYSEV